MYVKSGRSVFWFWRRRLTFFSTMSFESKSSKCTLYPIDDAYEPVNLPHNEMIVLGRSPLTKITDKRCSRSQVEVTADTDLLVVKLRHTGANKAGVNGLALEKKSSITLQHDDRIELVLGYFIYRIEFDPPLKQNEHNQKKRPLDEPGSLTAKKQRSVYTSATGDCDVAGSSSQSPRKMVGNESNWQSIHNGKLLVYTSSNVDGRSKIAAFDVDGTIILTKSGKVFPVNDDDWKLSLTEIPAKLKSMWEDGFKIVFMTNQAGIGKGKVNVQNFKKKIEIIVKRCGVPVQAFVSTGKSIYRKPAPGMWNVLCDKYNENIKVDISESFYCGDAAGRPVNWAPKKKKDFSSADRLLALNLNLKFFTPEEFFLKAKPAPFDLPEFNPMTQRCDGAICSPHSQITSEGTEVVLLVGSPGSGKSHFARTYLVPKGYIHVNRDTLGSWQKCVAALGSALSQGKSVVVDNTNPDTDSRSRLMAVAKSRNVPCRCFVMDTSLQHAKHNNRFRELTDDTHEEITDMVMNMYKKKYQEPSLQEGFSEIVKINCVPKFDKPELEKLYRMFLLEK